MGRRHRGLAYACVCTFARSIPLAEIVYGGHLAATTCQTNRPTDLYAGTQNFGVTRQNLSGERSTKGFTLDLNREIVGKFELATTSFSRRISNYLQ